MPRRGLQGLQRGKSFRLVALCFSDIQTRGVPTGRADRLSLWDVASGHDLTQLTVIVRVSVEGGRACYFQLARWDVVFVLLLSHLDVLQETSAIALALGVFAGVACSGRAVVLETGLVAEVSIGRS